MTRSVEAPKGQINLSDARDLKCNGHDTFVVVSSVLFVVYLALQAKKNAKRLCNGGSYIIISYYALLWIITLLNLVWSFLQAWQCSPGKEVPWNILSLFTTSGMLCLEISLKAFLLNDNYMNAMETLAHTSIVSGIIVFVDTLLKHEGQLLTASLAHAFDWELENGISPKKLNMDEAHGSPYKEQCLFSSTLAQGFHHVFTHNHLNNMELSILSLVFTLSLLSCRMCIHHHHHHHLEFGFLSLAFTQPSFY